MGVACPRALDSSRELARQRAGDLEPTIRSDRLPRSPSGRDSRADARRSRASSTRAPIEAPGVHALAPPLTGLAMAVRAHAGSRSDGWARAPRPRVAAAGARSRATGGGSSRRTCARSRRLRHQRSAAAEGVGAARSAAKSASVVSVPCPNALTTGSDSRRSPARTISSLNARRSSSDRRRDRRSGPRPRGDGRTNESRVRSRARPRDLDRGLEEHARGRGERRPIKPCRCPSAPPFLMSDDGRTDAVSNGSGRFPSSAKSPSAPNFRLSSSKRSHDAATLRQDVGMTTIWKRPRRGRSSAGRSTTTRSPSTTRKRNRCRRSGTSRTRTGWPGP